MKMKPMAPAKLPKVKVGAHSLPKPHIRARKLKPVPPGAFPQSPMAFPPDGGPMAGPADAMNAQPGGMPTGAAPGDLGE